MTSIGQFPELAGIAVLLPNELLESAAFYLPPQQGVNRVGLRGRILNLQQGVTKRPFSC